MTGVSLKDTIPQLIINDHSQSLEDTSPPPNCGARPRERFRPWLVLKSAELPEVLGGQARSRSLGRRSGTKHPVPSFRPPPPSETSVPEARKS